MVVPFPPEFYARSTDEVALGLLGAWLVHGETGGVVVETEAYGGPEDPASHAHRGPTPRASIMFESPGRAYVYFIYGNHFCLNAVAHEPGAAGAVLIRALEPRTGVETMRARRGRHAERELASGPGRLCQALGIDRSANGLPLHEGRLMLGARPDAPAPAGRPVRGPRIGITKAAHEPRRYFLEGNPHVSRGPSAKKAPP